MFHVEHLTSGRAGQNVAHPKESSALPTSTVSLAFRTFGGRVARRFYLEHLASWASLDRNLLPTKGEARIRNGHSPAFCSASACSNVSRGTFLPASGVRGLGKGDQTSEAVAGAEVGDWATQCSTWNTARQIRIGEPQRDCTLEVHRWIRAFVLPPGGGAAGISAPRSARATPKRKSFESRPALAIQSTRPPL
jgi:hypothetical protein